MLLKRCADTMSDAIALSSPNGRMSKRARKQAEDRLEMTLFGKIGVTVQDLKGERPEPTEKEKLLFRAKQDREFIKMCPKSQRKKLSKRAEEAERKAKEL